MSELATKRVAIIGSGFGGLSFDMGPSIITVPFLIEELFALNGEKMEDYLKLQKLAPFYRIYYHDTTYLDYSGDSAAMKKELPKLVCLEFQYSLV